MTQSFAEMFEESVATQTLRRGDVVIGTVVDIQSDSVIVHAGLKSEGVISLDEFKNAAGEVEVAVGDEVEVTLEAVEDGFGETKLSREKAKRDQVWRRLEKAFENEEIVKGLISGKVKGGFTVDIDEISSWTSVVITLWSRAVLLLKPSSVPSAKNCWRVCRKGLPSRAS